MAARHQDSFFKYQANVCCNPLCRPIMTWYPSSRSILEQLIA